MDRGKNQGIASINRYIATSYDDFAHDLHDVHSVHLFNIYDNYNKSDIFTSVSLFNLVP